MIQKRYQHISRNGIEWTNWYDYSPHDHLLKVFQKEEKWQLKNHLLNEFRVI